MAVPLQVLILEDQPADAELALHELRRAGFAPVWQCVEAETDYLAALDPSLDLILADYALPQFDALRALELLRARGLDIPFIIVSGTIGEDRAVAAIQRGATDYLIKDRLARLGAAVENALQQRRLQAEKLRADQLLDASEQRFRALIEHSLEGIVLVGADGLIRYASPSTERILGYAPATIVGMGIGLIHPEERADIHACLDALLQHPGQSTTAQGRARHANGGWRWLELVANNLLAEPSVGALVINYRDITERIQAEQALRTTEAKYRTLIEHIPAIVYQAALDETSSTLYVNAQIETMLGFTQAEWLDDPQRWLKQLHPRDLDQALASLSRTHAADTPTRSEFRMLTRDGGVIWFDAEAVIVHDPDGRPLFLQGIMLDITARKQAEEQIQQLNASLEQRVLERTAELARANAELAAKIVEQAQLEQQIQLHATRALALADISGMLAEAGHEIQQMLDAIVDRVAELIGDVAILTILSDDQQVLQVRAIGNVEPEGKAFMRTLFPATYPMTHQGLTGQVARTGQALLIPDVQMEQVRDQLNPDYVAYMDRSGMSSLLIVPVRARGRILGTLNVARDQPGRPYTTEDQTFLQNLADRAGMALEDARLFAAAEQARAEAERANRAKSAFLASMSHELRTPLNAILGFTGTLLMRLPGPLNADQEKQLTIVQRSGRHQLALINDLLDLAQIESGSVVLQLKPLDCQHVIAGASESLGLMAEQKGLRFAVETPTDPLMAVSDERALGQILLNLINNAIKFTDCGEVVVSLRRMTLDERPLSTATANRSAFVAFSVRDTGIGIRAEDQTKLFTEFGRVNSSEVREREGTGLGLRLSSQLAALLGGRIEVVSALGSGSTFTLILPEA